jgi:peptidoglycan L-alanyl-D-glutamate endopeptidase CwlK
MERAKVAFDLTPRDLQRLQGVHPELVEVIKHAARIGAVAFMVVEGVRSDEQCFINFGKGRTASQCAAGGCPGRYAQPGANKVTWVGHALSSNHRAKPDGYGHAVDLLPAPYDWKDTKPFDVLAHTMFAAAEILKVPIRWGADWDHDGNPRERGETDSPHFELGR